MSPADPWRARRFEAAAATLALALVALGCQEQRWEASENLRARSVDVAAALGDTSHENIADLRAEDVPNVPYPRTLRPCCAFAADFHVKVGAVPLPGVEISNVLGPEDVGPHRFDNGFLSIDASDRRGLVDNENNGLIYTCRGGFIDTAHIRDNADNTLSLATAAARMMDSGGFFEVPPQGAKMGVRFRPIPAEVILDPGRRKLAVRMARWLAFQLSVWHEIATFYGFASMASWPEKVSAFSPEDLYSNEIGARIAGGIVLREGARSDQEYGLVMDAWILRTLERLHATSLEDTLQAFENTDGAWWDSTKRIPDWTLVKRRRFDTGPLLRPWILEDASPGSNGPVEPLEACSDAEPPLVLHIHPGFAGIRFRDYATVEFEVEDALAEQGFPFPRNSRLVTQEDFPSIIEVIRAENEKVFGPGADRP